MNDAQIKTCAQIWNQGGDTCDMALAIFGRLKTIFEFPPKPTEAIIARQLAKIRDVAHKLRVNPTG